MRKNYFLPLLGLVSRGVAWLFILSIVSCSSFGIEEKEEDKVPLSFTIDKDSYLSFANGAFFNEENIVKSNAALNDTNNFYLRVYSTYGAEVYEGKYGDRPKDFSVLPGGYEMSLYSREKSGPKFDLPLFGDTLVAVVEKNKQLAIKFKCRQLSGGVRFTFSREFKNRFPGSGIFIEQNDNRLEYTYTEDRYVHVTDDYFSLGYNSPAGDTVLLSKRVLNGDMTTMNLTYSMPAEKNSTFGITVDTTRAWFNYSYNIGLKIPTGVYTIPEAKSLVGERNISVFGYIYGGDPTSISVKVRPPFKSQTTFVIAPSMTERNRNNCFVVELPSGDVRDHLNLVGYPGHIGRPVILTGTIVPEYYDYIGLKSTKAYTFMD